MTVGPVVGPFDNLTIIGATTYTLSEQGGALTNPPTSAGGDNNKTLSFTSSTAVTVTLPPALFKGFKCTGFQEGTGAVTYKATGGATLNGVTNGAVTSSAQYTRQNIQVVDTTGALGAAVSTYVITNEASLTAS